MKHILTFLLSNPFHVTIYQFLLAIGCFISLRKVVSPKTESCYKYKSIMDCDADTTNNKATSKTIYNYYSTVVHIFPPLTALTDTEPYFTCLVIVNCRWCNVACHYSVVRSAVVARVLGRTVLRCVKSLVRKLKPSLSQSHSWTASVHSWSHVNTYWILLT